TQKLTVSSNSIKNLSCDLLVSGLVVSGHMIDANDNSIVGLKCTTGDAIGIRVVSSFEGAHIHSNTVNSISSETGANSFAHGIVLVRDNVFVYNNFIYGLEAPESELVDGVVGIRLQSTEDFNMLYNNTIFLNASAISNSFSSTCIFAKLKSQGLDRLENNILV